MSNQPSSIDHPVVTQAVVTMLEENLLEVSDGLGTDEDLFALGFDSMGIMQLLLLIEEQYEVALPAADLSKENFSTASKIATLILSKRSAA